MKSSIILAISFGVIGSIASPPTLQLNVMRNPISGCVNTTDCSYGCSRFSTSSTKHSLSPLCQSIPEGSPMNMTIRGTYMQPYLYDEDLKVQFGCERILRNGTHFNCTQMDKDPVVTMNNSSSSSSIMGISSSHSAMMISRTPVPSQQSSSSSSSSRERQRYSSSSSTASSSSTPARNSPTTVVIIAPSTIVSTVTVTASPSLSSCVDSPGVYNMNHGNGNLNDCCFNSNDCHGSCIKGACDAENNKPPSPACINNRYFGRKNGLGPDGVCCETQQDCVESCVAGVCLTVT